MVKHLKYFKSIGACEDVKNNRELYLQLFEILMRFGKKLPEYKVFENRVKECGITLKTKNIKNFLTMCQFFEIINLKERRRIKYRVESERIFKEILNA